MVVSRLPLVIVDSAGFDSTAALAWAGHHSSCLWICKKKHSKTVIHDLNLLALSAHTST